MISLSSSWRFVRASPLFKPVVTALVLAVLSAALLVQLGIEWTGADGHAALAVQSKEIEFVQLKRATVPLRGLDQRVSTIRSQIDAFYGHRLTSSYSSVAANIRNLEVQSGAHLSQVVYTQRAKGTKLTELSINAGISGDYPQIMRFVNGLERSQTFFLIRGMTLNGEQGGQVNLRLRFSTWLRNSGSTKNDNPVPAEAADQPANNGRKE